MEARTLASGAPSSKPELPTTRAVCRAAIDQLRDDIEAIRAQIAAADLERQANHGRMDPRWYHRARTAIRFKRQEIAALAAHLRSLPPDPTRKDLFKDCLIEVLRDEFDDDAWHSLLGRAHARHDQRAGA